MAEAILFNLTADIIFKLGSSALREIGLLYGVQDDLDKLKSSLSAIQAVLHDAEEQQSKKTQVKDWVLKLKDVLYEIDDLIEESSYEAFRRQVLAKDRRKRKQVRTLFSKFKSNWKIGHKIKEIRQRLQAINDEKNQFSLSESVIQKRDDDELRKKRRETYSYINEGEVLGRNDDKEAVINLLLKSNTTENIAVISVIGMGGLGKTALAQSIYTHDNMINDGFELKLWVCVSDEFDLNMIIQKILESATGKKPESFLQLDSLQSELRKKIDGKKYLLVMDDVWNENKQEWLRLKCLLMSGAKGSRILITTRSEQVAKTFDTTSSDIHSLQYLDEQNSWLLFQKMTGLEGLDHNSNLIKIGKEIMLRLKGVPLSIKTIGGLLKDNKSERFWLSFKDKELYQVLGQGQDDIKEMQSILELSYKYLPAHLKQCFLYCALFPKDYEMKKDELILLWRAQGFIQPNDNNDNNLIDIGDDYFMELLSRSFFQEVKENYLGDIRTCKMHDLMHDLACAITDNKCVFGPLQNVNKRTHHISLKGYCHDKDQLMGALSKATQLRTFFLLDIIDSSLLGLEKKIHNYFRGLRTLQLKLYGNENFLKCIDSLKHLRYLSILQLKIKHLPDSIMKLYNLEVLIMCSNDLEKLPSDIKNLINLKHLDLSSNIGLEFLPDSITKLGKLETLILICCIKLKELPEDVKNWINLRELNLSYNERIEFLPNSITQLNNLKTLILKRYVSLRKLPEDTKRLINLKHLDLNECRALTHMPKGLGELTNLQTLNRFVLGKIKGGELNELNGLTKLKGELKMIVNLEYCTSTIDRQTKGRKFLQQKSGLQKLDLCFINSHDESTIGELDDVIYENVLDCLQPHSNLQEISIENYRGVKLCDWVSSNFLGCLVTLCLRGCERLQHLPRFDQFPNLKHLNLQCLPNIKYFIVNNDDYVSSSTFFSSLEKLYIFDMPKLKRLWNGTTSTESPIIFSCLLKLFIYGCPLQILKFFHAPNLKLLDIGKSELVDELNFVPWKFFGNLTTLNLSFLTNLVYLPECWEQYLTHLQHLNLLYCKNLKSLPERIQHIKSLKTLYICSCPILEERCKKDIGEDWPKIAHIITTFPTDLLLKDIEECPQDCSIS